MEQSARKGRDAIDDFSINQGKGDTNPLTGCGTRFFVFKENAEVVQCTDRCGGDAGELADAEEKQAIVDAATNNPTLLRIIEGSAGLCVPPEFKKVRRPTKQIFVNSDVCNCLNGKPDGLGDCQAFCANEGNTSGAAAVLHGNVNLGPEIQANLDVIGSLFEWCTKEIDDGNTSPSCSLKVNDGSATQSVAVTVPEGSNTFSAIISTLPTNRTFTAKIVENTSGAESDSFQFRRIPQGDTTTPAKPLDIMPINSYFCVSRSGKVDDNGNNFFTGAERIHFFIKTGQTAPVQPNGPDFLVCHDRETNPQDRTGLPRLGLSHQFTVWDEHDIRFADQNKNNNPDINETIVKTLADVHNENRAGLQVFGLFKWPNGPTEEGVDLPNVGFIMIPWINPQSGLPFCPTQKDYNGNDPVFKVLKDVVGIDTEAVYFAEREPLTMGTDPETNNPIQAPQDVIIIAEAQLKRIFFFIKDGINVVPNTDLNMAQNTIHFYWPEHPNDPDPTQQKPDQVLYTIKAPSQLGKTGNTSGLSTSISPRDNRFGCLPKSTDKN